MDQQQLVIGLSMLAVTVVLLVVLSLPHFEALLPGTNGELWVQEYAGLSAAPTRYLVLDRSGTPLARVSTPAAFRLTDIGSGYVVGIHRDDDGVETVRTYRLTRK